MKRLLAGLVVFVFLFSCLGLAFAGATAGEAKALVEKAVAFYKAHGKEKALAEFNNPKGQFVKGELYIFVFDSKGALIAHGANQKLVGQNMMDSQDPNGKYFARDFMKIGPNGGWVDYIWPNPVTKKLQAKRSYIKQFDDVRIGCGIYK